ncbi:MAG: hypothetical protein ACHRHE_10395 [Tepidisphaerales bacterium]
MNQSLKSIIALLILIALACSVFAWTIGRPDVTTWSFRLGAPVVTIALGWVLIRSEFRKDIVPDHLRKAFGSFFESDGLSFATAVQVENGICFLLIFFQNRYQRSCEAEIELKPAPGSFSILCPKIDRVRVPLNVGPAEFGFVRVPYPVPAKYQGKTLRYDVAANVKYPAGHGRMLRFRDGARVGPISVVPQAVHSAFSLLLVFVGVLYLKRPARCKISLPIGVANSISPELGMTTENIAGDRPPAYGFPVIQ